MRRCGECSSWELAGAPECVRCARLVDLIVEDGWRAFLEREFGPTERSGERPDKRSGERSDEWPGQHVITQRSEEKRSDERAIAEMVVDEPDRHPWRVVDAAYDRLTCPECGGRLSRGPAGCGPCDVANGFRYVAIEIDRPGVAPGNEHALRVNVSVVRRPYGTSAVELLARRLLLPILLEGRLPTTRQAQAARAMLNNGASAEEYDAFIHRSWGCDVSG